MRTGGAPVHAENERQVCRFAMLDSYRMAKNRVRLTRSARECTCRKARARLAFRGRSGHLAALSDRSAEIGSDDDGRVNRYLEKIL
jgi:hypothetical protein